MLRVFVHPERSEGALPGHDCTGEVGLPRCARDVKKGCEAVSYSSRMRKLFIALALSSLMLAQQKPGEKPPAPPPAVAPSDAQPSGAPASSVVPEISPELGNCTVEFKVTTMRGDGIYDAKITTTIRYGFLNKRRTELQIGTN